MEAPRSKTVFGSAQILENKVFSIISVRCCFNSCHATSCALANPICNIPVIYMADRWCALCSKSEQRRAFKREKKLKQVFLLSWGVWLWLFRRVTLLAWFVLFWSSPRSFAWALPFAVTLLPLFLGFVFMQSRLPWPQLFWTKGAERLLLFSLAIFSGDWLRSHILTGFPLEI